MKFPDFSQTILRKIFWFNTRNIQHDEGIIKVVVLENTQMFQLQMTLIKFSLLMTKGENNDHSMFLYMRQDTQKFDFKSSMKITSSL